MMHYNKGKNVEEEMSHDQFPAGVLPDQFLWMQVKGGSAVMNLVEHAKKALEDGTYRTVVWSGSDGGVGKTISCAEIMKRHFELHQVTRICFKTVQEFWVPQESGLEPIVAKRNIPCVHIITSLDEIDPKVPGYQHSKTQGGFWTGAGLGPADGSPSKRAKGPRPKEGGDKKGNYFTGPQLNKKANRPYSNGGEEAAGTSNGANREKKNKGKGGKPKDGGGGDGAGNPRNKGKQKDGNNRKKSNVTEVGEHSGGGGGGAAGGENKTDNGDPQ
ncbi:ribonuclease P protein subunit p25-like protein isoform X2 [Anopheles stephensi]|uniref:DNA/RNA-binding protein Alba-like domain-containing protein n=2 Tax=Anopheles stephensi TaxID=30069 RepID=A0A182XYJ1_ANOST|nr:ribonuclease P protein subunit p25-like protein isoform X2 [Anopheles stephensi]